jgi:predicted nucleic acid-binding protein
MNESNLLFDIRKELSLVEANEALKSHAIDFKKAFDLDDKYDIFLDTNVLLSYYGMAATEKEKLLQFLNENKERIYLTSEVQKEFRRNRLKRIEEDLFQPLRKIPVELLKTRKAVEGKFSSFLESHKKLISNDYIEEWQELQKVLSNLKSAISFDGVEKKLSEKIKGTIKGYKNINFQDDLMDICSVLNHTDSLEDDYIEEIKSLFDELAVIAFPKEQGNKDNSPESKHMFPGAGDYKNKKKDPYGDFIIFHEMLKYVNENKKDVIFLTNEKAKGDWLDKDLSAFVHYVEHTHNLSKQNIFVLNAEKPLSLSLTNIHKKAPKDSEMNFSQMSFDEQIDYMKNWLLKNYESPDSAGLPCDNNTSDYIYLWGEPLSTEEILEDKFYDITSLRVIEKSVSELEEEEDITMWVPMVEDRHVTVHVHRDFETCSDIGASGMFQIIGLSDDEGRDLSSLIDCGSMYSDCKDVHSELESILNAEVDVEFQ